MLGVAVALVVAVGLVYAVAATSATGTVKTVDVEKGTLVVTVENADVNLVINNETKVTEGDAAKTLADVKVGLKVTVSYAGEKNTVVSIAIVK